MPIMTARVFLLSGALLAFAYSAFAEGNYQQTRDGKTSVWNSNPKPGDAASWVGDRDRRGYATGFGTLTWSVERQGRTVVFARYFGKMVEGKFTGVVNAHSKGKTAHTNFVDGKPTSRWIGGPAPSRNTAAPPGGLPREQTVAKSEDVKLRNSVAAAHPEGSATATAPSKPRVVPKPAATAAPQTAAVPAAPAVGPSAAPVNRPSRRAIPPPRANGKPKPGVDDSLKSLAGPPSSLRNNPGADASPTEPARALGGNPPLSKEEVIDLANTTARAHGYDLAQYERAEARYNESDDAWALSYEQKSAESGKRFTVMVDGKTKKAAIVPVTE